MNRLLKSTLWAFLLLLGLSAAAAQESGWPRTLSVDDGMVTIYPLQVDGINGDVIHYRAALAFRPTPQAEPVFGAGWFDSKVAIDRDNRIVHPLDLTLTNTRFPAGTEDVQTALAAALAAQAPAWNLDYSLDELNAALKVAEAEARSALELNTAPPRIVYRDHPALLVTLDGEPVLRDIENSAYKAVINTPYPLIFDGKHYYLNAASGAWYRADTATGPYRFESSPPPAIAAMVKPEQADQVGEPPSEPVTAANAPEIVVSTQPAELIVTEGPAVFVPLVDDLLVLQNSDDDVFMHVGSQQFYIVLAGRWYHAGSLDGPWEYQAATELPPAFADIPYDSDQADARVHVAGTPEAEEAVLDAQLPQTAAVARGQADIDVDYDGDPDFRPVEGTDMQYAANTGATVLQSNRTYYLVEDGVWYVSATPNGPWLVSDYRPAAVTAIAPSSPVYNVKYVYIYDSTPDVVYVGYTPGYIGSYVYYGTVVYGTGWYYRPWVSPYYYYPRPSTWGFHVAYNPWYGWNFGLSWGWGWAPFYASYYSGGYWHHNHYWHHPHYGYWGPRGYRPRPPYYGHHGNRPDRYGHDRYGHDGYGRDRYGNRGSGHDSRGDRYRGRHDNLYRDQGQQARVYSTRDNLPRQRPGRDGVAWQAGDAARRDRAQPPAAGAGKSGRNRTTPVTTADVRRKAQLRDANFEARRSVLVADNSGNVQPRADRRATQRNANADRGKPGAGAKNRTLPVLANNRQNENRRAGPGVAETAPGRQPRPQASARAPARQPRPQASAQAPARQLRPQASAREPTRQLRSPVAEQKPAPQSRPPVARAPARQPGPGTVDDGARQPRSQAARAAPPQVSSRPVENRRGQPAAAARARPVTPAAAQVPPPGPRGNAPAQRQAPPVSAPQPRQNAAQQRPPAPSAGRESAPPAQRAPQGRSRDAGVQRSGQDRGAGRQGRRDH